MALVNGGTYYGLTAAEYEILRNDGEYGDIIGLFNIPVTIGGVDYYFTSSNINAMDFINRLDDDDTDPTGQIHTVTLDSAVYYSAYGFRLIGV